MNYFYVAIIGICATIYIKQRLDWRAERIELEAKIEDAAFASQQISNKYNQLVKSQNIIGAVNDACLDTNVPSTVYCELCHRTGCDPKRCPA